MDPATLTLREGRPYKVDAKEVETDDVPTSSWNKWWQRNVVNNASFIYDYQTGFDSSHFAANSTGDGSASVDGNRLIVNTGSGSGAGSTGRVTFIGAGNSQDQDLYHFIDTDWSNEQWWSAIMFVHTNDNSRIDYAGLGNIGDDKGVGFKIESEDLKAAVDNGTSENTSNPIVSGVGTGRRELYLHWDPGTALEVWVDDPTGDPDETMTTGLPSGARANEAQAWEVTVENTADVQRFARYGSVRYGGVA